MSVGYTVGKADVDGRAGALALALRNDFDAIRNFKIWLDAQTDQMLTALNYTPGDISTLRSAITDLAKLVGIYEGTQTQSPAYDFRTFAKLLTGVS